MGLTKGTGGRSQPFLELCRCVFHSTTRPKPHPTRGAGRNPRELSDPHVMVTFPGV